MIVKFGIKNFRAFKELINIPLSPLTCLIGRNSSGKSSIIQALLLLRQSIEQRALGSRMPQLNLSGTIVDAGSYDDIIHGHDTSLPLEFEFSVLTKSDYFRSSIQEDSSLVHLDVPRQSRYPYLDERLMQVRFYYRRYKYIRDRNVKISLVFLPAPPFGPTLTRVKIAIENLGHVRIVRSTGQQRIQHWRVYPSSVFPPPKSVTPDFSEGSFFPMLYFRSDPRKMKSKEKRKLMEFVIVANHSLYVVEKFLKNIKMVGPFRTPPARRYTFTGMSSVDIGISGERSVDLLITEKLIQPKNEFLRKGVSFWLKHLGLARDLSIKGIARKSNIFELTFAGAGTAKFANFADVGFGISQVLPVLVQGFLVPRGGTYIVQQPELHLHPDAQAALADYFLYLAKQGINVIIETHSEYILLRVRRRLAERKKLVKIGIPGEIHVPIEELKRDDISVIYSFEKRGFSNLRVLQIGESFQLENLPRGFMSEAIDDRLEIMKAMTK